MTFPADPGDHVGSGHPGTPGILGAPGNPGTASSATTATTAVACPPARVTPAGAEWLASASCFPRSVHALWSLRPAACSVLPCGTAFDVVSTAPSAGRGLLERLWSAGPGSGPVAVHRGRMLLFAEPGTADRLPALLGWEEWTRAETFPRLLCYGRGDAVTVPPVRPEADTPGRSRWLVAPDVRHPWLPGPETLLWACVRHRRATRRFRAGRSGDRPEVSVFASPERDAKVYDVTRRR